VGPKNRKSNVELKLPIEVVGRAEINGLLRELQAIEDYLSSQPGSATGPADDQLKLSQLLTNLAKVNSYNLLEANQRKELRGKLTSLLKKSPLLHISFAADASAEAVEQILVWLRANIHPTVLLQIGLQPNIVAGCMLRTPNQIFDFSLRQHMLKMQPQLVELLKGAVG